MLQEKNVDFRIFQFCQTTQLPDETIDQFVTRLCKLAATCVFHNVSREVKFFQYCASKYLRQYALKEPDISLDNLIAKVKSLEISEVQACGMEKTLLSEDVNRVSYKQPSKPVFHSQHTKVNQFFNSCRNYGLSWLHITSPCPAKGQQCYNCGKQNHFAKVCRSKLSFSTKPEALHKPFTSKRDTNS